MESKRLARIGAMLLALGLALFLMPGAFPTKADSAPNGEGPPVSAPSAGDPPAALGEVPRTVAHGSLAIDAERQALRRAALHDPSAQVAGNAIVALARLHALAGDRELEGLLDDPRLRVRQEVALGLGRAGRPASVRTLAKRLDAEEADAAAILVFAIAMIGGNEAREVLAAYGQRFATGAPGWLMSLQRMVGTGALRVTQGDGPRRLPGR